MGRTWSRRGLALALGSISITACARPVDDAQLARIQLPAGFHIGVYAEGVDGARSMALSPAATLFVGTRRKGRVYAVTDTNRDGRADRLRVIATGLRSPNGVAVRDGDLYVAEISRVLRYVDIDAHLDAPPAPVVLEEDLPTDRHHGWKFIRFGPDGKLYVPVGAPCNVCERPDPYAALGRMAADGGGWEIVARGIRNTVGFDWHPVTGQLWFTDNGRDDLGDDAPPDELNRAPAPGLHFGFPYCHGGDLPDPEFGRERRCAEFSAPARTLGAHVAALGMRFYTGTAFPAQYRNQIFIAEHGSWNRSHKVGYRVSLVRLDETAMVATAYEPFATGWLQGEATWGRPVDLQEMPDGALLVSDDQGGRIYRIAFDP